MKLSLIVRQGRAAGEFLVILKKSAERGRTQVEGLDSFHSFSFGDYYDPNFMGFSSLRVLNQDRLQGGGGFPTQFHHDLEIITFVLEGAIEHKDDNQTADLVLEGDVQVLSAGTGSRYTESNGYHDQAAHFFQIWIVPDKNGYEPSIGKKSFKEKLAQEDFVLLVSQNGDDDSVQIKQDIKLFAGKVDSGGELSLGLDLSRRNWVQVISGQLNINGQDLGAGDAVGLVFEEGMEIKAQADSRFLLFDLP